MQKKAFKVKPYVKIPMKKYEFHNPYLYTKENTIITNKTPVSRVNNIP